MIDAPLWLRTWGSRGRSWSWMRQGCSKKGSMRRVWRGTIVGRQGGLSTARLGCFWPMPVARAMPCWIVPSMGRQPGRTTASAVSARGIPAKHPCATKPQLARQMLKRAFEAQVPLAWVTGDSVYGDDRRLRVWLEEQEQAYVLAGSGKEDVWRGGQQHQVKTVVATLPSDGWTRLRAGAGAQGRRGYEWRWLPLAQPMPPAWRRWLLVRRRVSNPTDLTAYVVFAPHGRALEAVVRVAGSRWTVESCFEAAQGEVGLDQYEVYRWTGWYRHIPWAM
jgi:DDE superfamily endonuclease